MRAKHPPSKHPDGIRAQCTQVSIQLGQVCAVAGLAGRRPDRIVQCQVLWSHVGTILAHTIYRPQELTILTLDLWNIAAVVCHLRPIRMD